MKRAVEEYIAKEEEKLMQELHGGDLSGGASDLGKNKKRPLEDSAQSSARSRGKKSKSRASGSEQPPSSPTFELTEADVWIALRLIVGSSVFGLLPRIY